MASNMYDEYDFENDDDLYSSESPMEHVSSDGYSYSCNICSKSFLALNACEEHIGKWHLKQGPSPSVWESAEKITLRPKLKESIFATTLLKLKNDVVHGSSTYDDDEDSILDELENTVVQEGIYGHDLSEEEISISVDEAIHRSMSDNTTNTVDAVLKEHRSRRERALSENNICSSMITKCCKLACVQKLSYEVVKECREDLWHRTGADQSQFILDSIKYADRSKDNTQAMSFSASGNTICARAWRIVYGVSSSRYYEYLLRYRSNQQVCVHGNTGKPKRGVRYNFAKAWLKYFATRNGDKMPHMLSVHLPSCMSKLYVFNEYQKKIAKSTIQSVGISTFYDMWANEMSWVKIPKEDRFAKCSVCDDLKRAYQATRNPDRQKEIKVDLTAHYEHQQRQREVYYSKIAKSVDDPTGYLSIIIDGMDQNKTKLPHFRKVTKENQPLEKLKTHVTGVLVHGEGLAMAYIDTLKWPHDSNLTSNVLLQTLSRVAKKYNGHLPRVMFLQMDNCWRECKNRNVFALLGYLVLNDIFEEIQVAYLMQGHTHEDVDQFFSKISQRLNKEDCKTMDCLKNLISRAYEGAIAEELTCLLDVTGYLDAHINNLSGHSVPHAFKFRKDPQSQQLDFHYKDWASDDDWKLVTSNNGSKVNFFRSLPGEADVPQILKPNIERMKLTEFENTVACLYNTGKISTDDKNTWLYFIQLQRMPSRSDGCRWMPATCKKWYDRHPQQECERREEEEVLRKLYANLQKSRKTGAPKITQKRKKK